MVFTWPATISTDSVPTAIPTVAVSSVVHCWFEILVTVAVAVVTVSASAVKSVTSSLKRDGSGFAATGFPFRF